MTKEEKILMGLTTLLCPPVGLIAWFKLQKIHEKHEEELGNIITKGFGGIAEALGSKNNKEDA